MLTITGNHLHASIHGTHPHVNSFYTLELSSSNAILSFLLTGSAERFRVLKRRFVRSKPAGFSSRCSCFFIRISQRRRATLNQSHHASHASVGVALLELPGFRCYYHH